MKRNEHGERIYFYFRGEPIAWPHLLLVGIVLAVVVGVVLWIGAHLNDGENHVTCGASIAGESNCHIENY